MILKRRHTLFAGRILVGLFLLSNSGFTLAFHACMPEMSSCCPSSSQPQQSGVQKTLALSSPTPFCCEVRVAGGANDALPSIVQSSTPEAQKPHPVATHESSAFGTPCSMNFCSRQSSMFQLPTSPRVEKYVLNAAFLI